MIIEIMKWENAYEVLKVKIIYYIKLVYSIYYLIALPNCQPGKKLKEKKKDWKIKIIITAIQTDVWNLWVKLFFFVHFFPEFFCYEYIHFVKRMKYKLCDKKKGMRQREGRQASLRPGLNPFSSCILLKDCCIWPCETACQSNKASLEKSKQENEGMSQDYIVKEVKGAQRLNLLTSNPVCFALFPGPFSD